ncbi:MAG: DUF805 domain-containing protein [Hyphomonas sp.]|uniref:DUF805 domain-containing protein n=1 Tax=Hyphomonas sp. TaxID=87 RepID=UPI001DFCFDF7|nr:DUF805 domain-containing protein [Hyphomonas sp.]MBA4226829.1 DUF805 domain-containing protein [Hyphomonas sp.]
MRGEVLKSDSPEGPGLILGEDGQRYRFSQLQVHNGSVLRPGSKVDFVPTGDEARDIYALGAPQAAAPQAGMAPGYAAPRPPPQPNVQSPPYAVPSAVPAEGLWTYFTRALTTNYVQFNGRARRSEYWGFTLFLILAFIAVVIVDVFVSVAVMDTDSYGDPGFLPIFTLLLALYSFLPSIAITVRRLHDQDLSGWLYLISLIPYIGGLILLVFMLLDGKPAPNKHGDSPKYGAQMSADVFA